MKISRAGKGGSEKEGNVSVFTSHHTGIESAGVRRRSPRVSFEWNVPGSCTSPGEKDGIASLCRKQHSNDRCCAFQATNSGQLGRQRQQVVGASTQGATRGGERERELQQSSLPRLTNDGTRAAAMNPSHMLMWWDVCLVVRRARVGRNAATLCVCTYVCDFRSGRPAPALLRAAHRGGAWCLLAARHLQHVKARARPPPDAFFLSKTKPLLFFYFFY